MLNKTVQDLTSIVDLLAITTYLRFAICHKETTLIYRIFYETITCDYIRWLFEIISKKDYSL